MSKANSISYGEGASVGLEASLGTVPSLATEQQASRSPLSILVVSRRLLVREALLSLVGANVDLTALGHCSAVTEAMNIASVRRVDCAIVEVRKDDEPWALMRDGLRALSGTTRVLALLDSTSPLEAARFLDLGIAAVLPCTVASSALLQAIRKMNSGAKWSLVESISDVRHSNPFTPRQRTVLRLLYEGYSNKEIAGHIGVSDSSVKCTIQQLFRKLGARSRAQLIRVVLESSPELLATNEPVAMASAAISAG